MVMKRTLGAAAVLAFSVGVVGCSGSTDGGSAADPSGSPYSSDSAGSIDLSLPSGDEAAVADVLGFRVAVRDQNGAPVPNVRISCDTEAGLALIEPTTGIEQTDGMGEISGKVGCTAPGSYLIGCRLPVGANKRVFETIRCSGPVPTGFNGFAGAGGGTLGGGASPDNGSGTVRIVSAVFTDTGTNATTSQIDVEQLADCPNTTPVDPEKFFDTMIKLTVVNDSNETVRFNSYRYTVQNGSGAGSDFNSGSIGFIGNVEGTSAEGSTTLTLDSLFASASGGSKYFFGSSTPISASLGIQNIDIELTGTTSSGATVTAEI